MLDLFNLIVSSISGVSIEEYKPQRLDNTGCEGFKVFENES